MKEVSDKVLNAGIEAPGPIYVYDLERLEKRCRMMMGLPIARKRVFFATMANDHPEVLATIRDNGLGVFVNSPAHLQLALELGFEPSNIIYAASNMHLEEMRACIGYGVHLVLDSIGQIETFAAAGGRGRAIGLRVNVGSALDRGDLRPDPGYRFGLLVEELPRAVALAAQHGIRLIGVHSYFGTGLMRPEILIEGLQQLGQAAGALPDLTYVDVGGGLGVPDTLDQPEFDLDEYGRRAAEVMEQHERRLGREIQLYIEPGRYLAADCGYFFVKVTDNKLRDDRVFVGTNGSVVHFPRPLFYPEIARHPCEIIGERRLGEAHPKPVWVCGNSTYSQDFLARGIPLPLPQPGDTLIFYYAGAYGRSMMTRFLGKDRPTELVFGPVETASSHVFAQGSVSHTFSQGAV